MLNSRRIAECRIHGMQAKQPDGSLNGVIALRFSTVYAAVPFSNHEDTPPGAWTVGARIFDFTVISSKHGGEFLVNGHPELGCAVKVFWVAIAIVVHCCFDPNGFLEHAPYGIGPVKTRIGPELQFGLIPIDSATPTGPLEALSKLKPFVVSNIS